MPTATDAVGSGTSYTTANEWDSLREARASRGAIFPVGTTREPAKAVAHLLKLADNNATGYWGQCQRLADDAYMPRGPRVSSAYAQWQRALDAGVGHRKDEYPPIGAQMFWKTDNPAWHVATYVGEGKVVTNMSDGSVKSIAWRRLNEWGPYLGWAPPYYK